ncbi:MAG: hypothetical protein KJ737_10820 [Proteobacteria bacterium]|nr:hypothetical protein [Pseudomonadota bacterium]
MHRSCHILIFVFVFILVAGSLPAGAEEVNVHGFISQGYLQTNQNNYLAETDDGSFQFNEMGINFTTAVSDRLTLGCQFFARDLGDVGNDEIVINWAFAEFEYKNWLNLRVGTLKGPFGLYNDLRDFDALRTSIFLPSSVYNEWLRDGLNKLKGIELFGTVILGPLGLVQYQTMVGQPLISMDSGTVKFIQTSGGIDSISAIENDDVYGARLIWTTPLTGLRICGTYIYSNMLYKGIASDPRMPGTEIPLTVDTKNAQVCVFSAEYIYGDLKLSAENYWALSDNTATATINIPGKDPIENIVHQDIDVKDSYYVSIGYRFAEQIEAAFYYSEYVSPEGIQGTKEKLKDQCLSFRFDINPFWVAKLEAHVMDGKFGVLPDNDGHTYNEWMLYAAKMSYSF